MELLQDWTAVTELSSQPTLQKRPQILKNGPTPVSFLLIFGLFKQKTQFYDNSMRKNVMSIQYMAPRFEQMTSQT